ncbi:phosphatidylethanolamine-binding protein 4 [Ambystoma mexicanum]|uniref:phosphatidylethanolamine-binding protein 4 n=1 Tax=Ambystoma mexicanum TaxID=8296 RepID=UPI0037E9C7D5
MLSSPRDEVDVETHVIQSSLMKCSCPVSRQPQQVRMLVLVALFLLCKLGAAVKEKNVCVFETLQGEDGSFCRSCMYKFVPEIPTPLVCKHRGGLQIIYPGLDASCNVIPSCAEYRESLINAWGPPLVKFPYARLYKKYVLIMVDPDAPNRAEPTKRFWRHWLVTDIQGQNLMDGKLNGRVLSDYRRPNPPHGSGYHRYQFLLFEQPGGEDITMTDYERRTRASWNMDKFIDNCNLGTPEATAQFQTENV